MNPRSLLLFVVALAVLLPSTGCSKASRKARHQSKGDAHYAAGEYDSARIEYLNVLKLEPQDPHAIGRLGTLLFDSGMGRQAAPYLARAASLNPTNAEVRLKLAHILALAGQPARAREELRAALAAEPTHAEALQFLAELATEPKEVEATEQHLAQLRSQTGANAALHLAQANLLLRRNNLTAAEEEVGRALALDPKSATAHSALAGFHLMRTNLAAAEQELRLAAELSPLRSGRRLRYAEFLIRNGKPQDGREVLESLTRQAPDLVPAWTSLASLSFDQKRYDEAQTQLERALARDPANYEAGVLQARLRLLRNEPARALEELQRLAKIHPQSVELRYQLALACLLNRDLAEAENQLQAAIALNANAVEPALLLARLKIGKGDYPGALETLTRISRGQPQFPGIQLALGEAYAGSGRFDDALGVYRSFSRAHPQDPQGPFLAGLVLRQQNKPAEARLSFEQSVQLEPTHLGAIAQLVELDLLAQNSTAALQRAVETTRALPESAPARLLLARVHLAARDTRQAEPELKKALELDPANRTAYLLLAQLYVSNQQQDDALKQLDALLARTPGDARGLMLKATIYNEAKDYARARDAYEKLLAAHPDSPPALNNLAFLYLEQLDQADRAYELARRARTLKPQDPYIADTLGWVMYRRGEYPEALAMFLESAAQLRTDPEILYHLALGHYMMGQERPARIALEQALGSPNDFAGKADARKKLSLLAIDPAAKTTDPQTLTALQSALADAPGDPVAAQRLGAVYEREADWAKAKAVHEAVLKVNPKAVPSLLQLARLNAGPLKDPARALELARTARDLAKTDPQAAHTVGQLALQAGDHAWALSLLQDASRRLADQPEILYDLAWAQFGVGQLTEAQESLRKALKVDPNFPRAEAARQFASMLTLAADPAREPASAAAAQQLLQADPQYAPALVVAAQLYQHRNQTEASRKAWELVLGRYPLFTPANRALARLYLLDPPDPQKAYDHGVKARQAYPGDPDVARSLGLAVYRRGDYRRAVSLLQETLRKEPNDVEALYYLGRSHLQLKEPNPAREALQKAAANTTHPLAAEASKALAELK